MLKVSTIISASWNEITAHTLRLSWWKILPEGDVAPTVHVQADQEDHVSKHDVHVQADQEDHVTSKELKFSLVKSFISKQTFRLLYSSLHQCNAELHNKKQKQT